jgi:BON domain
MWRIIVALVVVGNIALGGEPLALRGPGSDRILSLKVTSAIQSLPELRQVPLIVDVVRGVAVVGGEVPDLEILPRLRSTILKTPGIVDLKLSCWESSDAEKFAARVQSKLSERPKIMPPSVLPSVTDHRALSETIARKPTQSRAELLAEAVRKSERRYAGLRFEWQGGMVTISGEAPRHEDVTELVERLRKVPGIERVRRGAVRAE